MIRGLHCYTKWPIKDIPTPTKKEKRKKKKKKKAQAKKPRFRSSIIPYLKKKDRENCTVHVEQRLSSQSNLLERVRPLLGRIPPTQKLDAG
jgi:ABC-type oligopeptide transport system ATPase subunit